jgi:hypothetical protein
MITSTDSTPMTRDLAIEELRLPASLIGRRGLSDRTRTEIGCGPDTPLRYFTAGAFAAAYDTASRLTEGNNPEMFALRAAIMETFLHLNSDHVKMQKHLGGWTSHALSSDGPPILKSDSGVVIDLFYSQRTCAGESKGNSKPNIFFGSIDLYEHTLQAEIQHPLVNDLKRLLSRAIESKVVAGHASLIFPEEPDSPVRYIALEILKALKNSPTAKRIESIGREETPGRFRFVDELHATQTDSAAVEGVLTYFQALPALMMTRGWCEGMAIHDASQYGARGLIEGIRAAIDQHGQSLFSEAKNKGSSKGRYTFQDLLHITDRDGATPLHRAALSGHWEIAEDYIRMGANPEQVDRYGWSYSRYLSDSIL